MRYLALATLALLAATSIAAGTTAPAAPSGQPAAAPAKAAAAPAEAPKASGAASAGSTAATAPKTLSLSAAASVALAHNPTLAGVRQEVAGAVARLRGAKATGRLTAAANTLLSTGTMTSIIPAPMSILPRMYMGTPGEERAAGSLMLMYPLSTGGRVTASIGAANAGVAAAGADLDTAVLEVVYGARAAYWKVLLAREIVKVQQQNLAESQERLRVDNAAYAGGKIPRFYILRDKAEVAAAQQQLTDANRDLDVARYDLSVALGLAPSASLRLTSSLTYDPAAVDVDIDALVKKALAQRPEAKAVEAQLKAAQEEVSARRAAYRPQVNGMLMLMGDDTSGMGTAGGYSAGVVASLPILDGGARSADVDEAKAVVGRIESRKTAIDLEIERQVRAAGVALKAADQNVRTAMEALASATEDHRVALLRYEAGKAINLEPISALAVLVRARTNLAQALYEHNLARDSLARAVGRLPKTQTK